jgi:hypothetical protein
MGREVFRCSCGEFAFLCSTDNRSYAAHLIPDQDWDLFWGAIEDAIEKSGPSERDKADACIAARGYRARMLWQCFKCSALYLKISKATTIGSFRSRRRGRQDC